ncbi:hypothetical protein O1611_g688 [Lasiodiplodia mahajangana]|uniref:Uncharacterized protein n=1 Tax=Lasiodiplodia mahajangana TaxID=1108764 RepID=A0ACC2JZH7_9PEZI|nr:hypothetical protein O1611_g688 [Lasiodiplodia mahajangana]
MDLSYHGDYEHFRGTSTPKTDNRGIYEMVTPADNPHTDPLIVVQSKESASWGWEIFTLVMSAVLFGAQVGILLWVKDKPYYQTWGVPYLSLNAAIAILTTACKASQLHAVSEALGQVKWINFKTAPRRLKQFELYDATSRGPGGAALFVSTVRWNLATLGAFVVILALVADPFTQQVIELVARNVTTPDNTALFGFAQGYNTNPLQTALNGVAQPDIASRDPGIQGAILRGIYNIKSPDEFQCGGACSWNGTYKSLGVSSTCNDIKETVEATKVCSKSENGVTTFCNYTTPGDVHFSTEYVRTDSATALLVAVNDTLLTRLSPTPAPRVPAEFLQVAVFQSNSGEKSSFNDEGIIADNITECTLSLSLHEYSNIQSNGSQLLFDHVSRKLEPGWQYYNSSISDNPRNITFNQSDSGPIDPPFIVNGYDWASAVLFFESTAFISHIISGNAIKGKDTDRIGTGTAFLNTDVPTVFSALAQSMTDYLRSLSKGPNIETAQGARVESVVFVHIRLEWLILPLVQELGAILFVIWVIIYNKHHSVPGWKSSALAALAHNIHHHNSLVTNFRGPKEIEKYAENVDARLR